MKKGRYFAPAAEVIEIRPESIILISGLEDYGDNDIFGDAISPE